ncbi:MAG: YpdA family putative bacillithiol disulfide reductase [Chlorobi bacterium]|nr:YpdA family putative bacillithiol disulfide reductase [Chlorobiota bacterium]
MASETTHVPSGTIGGNCSILCGVFLSNWSPMMLDVAIIGAGPTGLACAIEALRSNLQILVFDKGSICDSIRRFPVGMTFFSTPEQLELGGIPFTTSNIRPTRIESLQYYRLVAQRLGIPLQLYTRVRHITRNSDSFLLDTDRGVWTTRFVIVATGYFDHTNRLGVEGEDLPHVRHYYTEAFEYSGTRVLVVGGKNSAVEAALDLWRHGATVALVHRRPTLGESVKYWLRPDIENRIRNGEISAYFSTVVRRITPDGVELERLDTGERWYDEYDFILLQIGYRPDAEFLRRCGVEVDPHTLIPRYNPETFETNVPGLYVAGSVMCGCETWNIFIENGRSHARPILADIRWRCGASEHSASSRPTSPA